MDQYYEGINNIFIEEIKEIRIIMNSTCSTIHSLKVHTQDYL